MLTSAGGILALLQDNPQVKDGSKTEDVQLKVGSFFFVVNGFFVLFCSLHIFTVAACILHMDIGQFSVSILENGGSTIVPN